MNKPGPKPKNKYECSCCLPSHIFDTSLNKGKHEYRQRQKKKGNQSQATPSLVGESFVERMEDFQIPQQQQLTLGRPASAFK